MSAPIPAPVQQRIAALRKQGRRINDIAAELKLGRHTVSGYCAKFDHGQALQDAPAATLDAAEVAALRALLAGAPAQRQQLDQLARSMVSVDCPSCLTATVALRSQSSTRCRGCRAALQVEIAPHNPRRYAEPPPPRRATPSHAPDRALNVDRVQGPATTAHTAVDEAIARLHAQLAPLQARMDHTEAALRRR